MCKEIITSINPEFYFILSSWKIIITKNILFIISKEIKQFILLCLEIEETFGEKVREKNM